MSKRRSQSSARTGAHVAARALPNWRLIAFSCGGLGTGVFSTAPAVLLLYYLTQYAGLSGALAGTALFLPKLWDVVTDPFVGVASDRLRSPWGRRLPFLLAGAVLTPAAFFALFFPPMANDQLVVFGYIVIVFMLAATSYSLFSVPFIAVPAEISEDTNERLRIMSFRSAGVMLGVLLGSALPTLLIDFWGETPLAYQKTAGVLALFIAAGMFATFWGLCNVKLAGGGSDRADSRTHSFFAPVQFPAFFWLALTHIFEITAVGVILAGAGYLAVFALGLPFAASGVFLAGLLVSAIVAMPFWTIACRRFGKSRCFAAGALLFGSGAMFVSWLPQDFSAGAYYGLSIVMGVGFAAVQLTPYALLTDVIHQYGARAGAGAEGAFTGAWTALEKVGLAIAPFLLGVGLDAGGFAEGLAPSEQSAGVSGVVRMWTGLAPMLIMMCCLIPLAKLNKHLDDA